MHEPSAREIEAAFGKWIRDTRSASGVTQSQLADVVGLDASAISRLEGGTRSIRLSEAVIVARALGVEILPEPLRARLEPTDDERLLRELDRARDVYAAARAERAALEMREAVAAQNLRELEWRLAHPGAIEDAKMRAQRSGKGVLAAQLELAERDLLDRDNDGEHQAEA